MMVRAAIALAALMIVPCAARAADSPDCRLMRYAAIPFTTLADGRIAIPVGVDGHPASFLVDTGGVYVSMTPELAKQTGRTPKQVDRWLVGVGGSMMTTAVHVDEFTIDKLKGSGIPVYVDTRLGIDVDGTVDPDMMAKFDVDFDFAHGLMNLFSQDHCPGKVVYWARNFVVLPMEVRVNNGHIRVPVTLEGKKVMAMLDTGSTDSVMSLKLAKALGIAEDSPDLKLTQSAGSAEQFRTYSYPFKMLDMDGIAVTNPHITVMSDAMLPGMGDDVILGMGILRQLHLYIAYKEEKLYVTPAE
ncbi:MAG TPA: aspartyl protease family protein [Rhizomicrobium sp.]|jgi:predicted aspartyl protease|nr:aspartyl protease family protein [Rhizomicrobium sp.]